MLARIAVVFALILALLPVGTAALSLDQAPVAVSSTVAISPIVEVLSDGSSRVSCPAYGILVSSDGSDTLASLVCEAD